VNLREIPRRLNRAQRGLKFKVFASGVIGALALTVFVWLAATGGSIGAPLPDPSAAAQIEDPQIRVVFEQAARTAKEVFEARDPVLVLAGAVVAVSVVALAAIWLGLGLTYLGLAVLVVGVAAPLSLVPSLAGAARVLSGIAILSGAMVALLEGTRLVLSLLPGAVSTIARNVLSEAVRMKISLVFIVLLILGLSALPGMLAEQQFLRYRVQSFISMGTGGSFALIALMTVLFSAASVTGEQRTRVIWQTMTKPVSAWEYILGKWLGMVLLSGILLLVSGVSIFMFTEYLRSQRAYGEVAPYMSYEQYARGYQEGVPQHIAEDRRLLHFQVLQARVSREPEAPFSPDDPEFLQYASDFIQNQARLAEGFQDTPAQRRQIIEDLYTDVTRGYRAIEPFGRRQFVFTGLERARERGVWLMLRYKFQAGENLPDQIYRVSYEIGPYLFIRDAGLNSTFIIDQIPADAIEPDGTLSMFIHNVDITTGAPNPETIYFPPGGLELAYSVGGYQMNFARVMFVMWVKLAFLAMLGVAAGTFLSFPVACLIAVGAFFAAESSGYLAESVEYYLSARDEGLRRVVQMIVGPIASGVAWLFSTYGELRPTEKLVEGQLVTWRSIGGAVGVLGAWCAALFALAVAVFRRRELALYSGQ
jgi:hypothetical protein